ncbi:MAG: DUF1552 domain-containing protein [Verrucomicrobiaceae bacterium]|nr:DUF1552 domain-containing protein [Verrucomicrobiaceae bacterium]
MNPRSALSRRLFLQGTGISLTLPAFESFAADKAPPRRLVCVGNHLGFYPGHFFPKDTGKAYTATSTLKPLEADRDDLTIFSNLDHGLNGGHNAVQGFLNSIKKEEAAGFPDKNISLDQAAAEHVGSATRQQSRHPVSRPLRQLTAKCPRRRTHPFETSRQRARCLARFRQRLEPHPKRPRPR